jgi:hypothetical protein
MPTDSALAIHIIAVQLDHHDTTIEAQFHSGDRAVQDVDWTTSLHDLVDAEMAAEYGNSCGFSR